MSLIPITQRSSSAHMIYIMLLLSCALHLVSCRRGEATASQPPGTSVEALRELEIITATSPGPYTREQIHEELERDLVELRQLGMVERAWKDIKAKMPEAKSEKLWIGYFMNTNIVVCRLSYRPHHGGEAQWQEFNYMRDGTNWTLRWDETNAPSK